MLNQEIFKFKSDQIVQDETRINVIFDLKLEVQVVLSKTDPFISDTPLKASAGLRIQQDFIPL